MPIHHALTDEQYESVTELVAAGRKIEAIKQYRAFTGADLAVAKKEVEQFLRPAKSPEDVSGEMRELLASGKKIEAIKKYREQTGSGLREAKEAVERMERSFGGASSHPHTQSTGCGSNALVLFLVAVVVIVRLLA